MVLQFVKFIYGSTSTRSNVNERMTMGYLFNLLILSFTYLIVSNHLACAISSPSMILSPGLKIKLQDSYTESNNGFIPIKTKPYSLAVPAYGNGFFFPILSSINFNSNSTSTPGYSFGYLLFPRNGDSRDHSDIYLSICTGKLGKFNVYSLDRALYVENDNKKLIPIRPYYTLDGIAFPISIFNRGNPITSFTDFYLSVSSINAQLELWNSSQQITWSVPNAAMMNITDDGDLQIFGSNNIISFQSSTGLQTDTLLPNENLNYQGKSLISNNSDFVLKMELGGLALYLDTQEQDYPYWTISLINDTDVQKPPCDDRSSLGQWDGHTLSLIMDGLCGNTLYKTQIFAPDGLLEKCLLKLENDGRVYFYMIDTSTSSVKRSDFGLDYSTISTIVVKNSNDQDANNITSYSIGNITSYSLVNQTPTIKPDYRNSSYTQWGICDSPIACGGLSICTPHVQDSGMCRCPPDQPDLNGKPTFSNQKSKGCKRSVQLSCDQNSTFFVINKTAVIPLFSGWEGFPKLSLDECKQQCSSLNCTCTGLVYDWRRSFCLHITDELTLLDVSNDRTNPLGVSGADFITLIKITKEKTNSSWWSSHVRIVIGIAIPVVFFFCVIVGSVWFILLGRTNRWSPTIEEDESELADILPMLPSRFCYQDLHQATQGFTRVLGKGGCGSVYGGILPDGRKVAVKKLEYTSNTTNSRSFLAEVATIGRTNHQNVVRLEGFCWEHSNRLLVYDFIERGSLDQWLFQNEQLGMLDWSVRYNIAIGIAKGLKYLHEDCPQPILHLDIKPQNILLDNAFVAKLADFGMSRLMDRDISYVVTQVRGTPGYIAPEWHLHGGVSKKCDVYSMGIVMLEIVAGRRNIDLSLLDTEACEQWHLSSWAVSLYEQGKVMDLLDKRLDSCSVNQGEVFWLIKTALWCIQEDPCIRPQISTVVQWLEGRIEIEDPPLSSVSQVKKASAKPLILSITSSSSGTKMFTSTSAFGY